MLNRHPEPRPAAEQTAPTRRTIAPLRRGRSRGLGQGPGSPRRELLRSRHPMNSLPSARVAASSVGNRGRRDRIGVKIYSVATDADDTIGRASVNLRREIRKSRPALATALDIPWVTSEHALQLLRRHRSPVRLRHSSSAPATNSARRRRFIRCCQSARSIGRSGQLDVHIRRPRRTNDQGTLAPAGSQGRWPRKRRRARVLAA